MKKKIWIFIFVIILIVAAGFYFGNMQIEEGSDIQGESVHATQPEKTEDIEQKPILNSNITAYVKSNDADGVFFKDQTFQIHVDGCTQPDKVCVRLFNETGVLMEKENGYPFEYRVTGDEGLGGFFLEMEAKQSQERISVPVLRGEDAKEEEIAILNFQPKVGNGERITISDLRVFDNLRNVQGILFCDKNIGEIELVDPVDLLPGYNYHPMNGLNDSNIVIESTGKSLRFGISKGDNQQDVSNLINSGGRIAIYYPRDYGIKTMEDIKITKYLDGVTSGVAYPTQISIEENRLTFIVDDFGIYEVSVKENPTPTVRPTPVPNTKTAPTAVPTPSPEPVVIENDMYGEYIKESEKIKNEESSLKIGDYLLFGKYYNQSILFRVIDIDKNGNPMIFADEILCYKAFSAAQDGSYGLEININNEFDMDYENNPDIKYCIEYIEDGLGSNRWSQTSIRDWLNSCDKTVKYTTHPPVASALSNPAAAYASEPGFLYNFSKDERNVIVPVTHKSLLNEWISEEIKDGGMHRAIPEYELWTYNYCEDYENVNFEYVEDKVFFISIQEFKDFILARGWDYNVYPKQIAVDMSKVYRERNKNAFWFRTPCVNSIDQAMLIYRGEEGFWSWTVSEDFLGIRPAMYINQDAFNLFGGLGTKEAPYILEY